MLDGIALAGGIRETGDIEGAYVIRAGKLLPVSLGDILLRGDTSRNVAMQHGDMVYVPDKTDWKVYVLGEVEKPGIVPMDLARPEPRRCPRGGGGARPPELEEERDPDLPRRMAEAAGVRRVDQRMSTSSARRSSSTRATGSLPGTRGLATWSRAITLLTPWMQSGATIGGGLGRRRRQLMLDADVHSHLMPGVDGGRRGPVETVAMARGLAELGVRRVYLTPHQFRLGNSFEAGELRRRTDEVARLLAAAGIPLEVGCGAEHYYGEELLDAVGGQGDLIPFDWEDERCLLVELPLHQPAVGVRRVGEALLRRGIRPILAHPERTAPGTQSLPGSLGSTIATAIGTRSDPGTARSPSGIARAADGHPLHRGNRLARGRPSRATSRSRPGTR